MNQEDLRYLLSVSPAIQILRLRNAHWVLPFLYQVFKEENRFLISEAELIFLLSDTLRLQEDSPEDMEEAKIVLGENEESRCRKYLLNWVQRRMLQDLQDAEGVVQYQLSAHTEKVFQWMIGLQERNHVGTESRFKLLFSSLRDIIEHTEDDRAKRLEFLKDKRAQLDKEIMALEYGNAPDNYSDVQIQERIQLFTRLCYEMIGDFREVEDNFKQIHRAIVEQHTVAEQNKGAIVGYAFEAYDALRTSNQGKSFYAFWDFLISRAGQQHWHELTEKLVAMLEERAVKADVPFLQNVKALLLQQGRVVSDANDRMAEKLSRIITEKELAAHKRTRQQIGNIKRLLLELRDEDDVPAGLQLPESIAIKMIMERRLQLATKKSLIQLKQPKAASEKITDPERFSRLIHTAHIDKKKLLQKIEAAFRTHPNPTLKEVLDLQPLEHGIAEVVSYYSFLRDKRVKAQVVPETTEHIPLNKELTKFVEVPYLFFSQS